MYKRIKINHNSNNVKLSLSKPTVTLQNKNHIMLFEFFLQPIGPAKLSLPRSSRRLRQLYYVKDNALNYYGIQQTNIIKVII